MLRVLRFVEVEGSRKEGLGWGRVRAGGDVFCGRGGLDGGGNFYRGWES